MISRPADPVTNRVMRMILQATKDAIQALRPAREQSTFPESLAVFHRGFLLNSVHSFSQLPRVTDHRRAQVSVKRRSTFSVETSVLALTQCILRKHSIWVFQ